MDLGPPPDEEPPEPPLDEDEVSTTVNSIRLLCMYHCFGMENDSWQCHTECLLRDTLIKTRVWVEPEYMVFEWVVEEGGPEFKDPAHVKSCLWY